MKRYFATIFTLAGTLIRRFFRDPVALFFTFLFPLLFLFVFGSIFRGGESSFDIALINHSQTQFAKEFEAELKDSTSLKLKNVGSLNDAKEKMGRGELDSIIELPKAFGEPGQNKLPSGKLVVYYEEASPQSGQTLASIMQQQILEPINQQLTRQKDPFVVEQKATKTANLSQLDYTFSGLIGFSILSLGIFGMANGFPADKKAGILRRLRATPLKASQLIVATALEFLLIGALSIILMMVIGMLVFGFQMRGDYFNFAVFCILGIITMFGFGLAIGGWARNENQAAPLSNLVSFPMMFLSGAFFPRFIMPEWLQSVTAFIPLTPVIDGLRLIMTEGKVLTDLLPQIGVMGIWVVVIYFIAFKTFRWE